MSTAHSTLGPSGANRWINCAGSVALEAQAPRMPSSEYAEEGTVAHALAEEYVTGKIDFLEMAGRVGKTVKSGAFDIEITDEMVDGAVEYHDAIKADREEMERARKPAPVVGKAELRVHARSVDERVWGTADYVLYRKGDRLKVYDYKYGKGKVVEVEDNEQALLYAIGVMETEAGTAFDEVELIIVQPRASHAEGTVRRWIVPPAALADFRARAAEAAAETLNPEAAVVAGDWCRWCRARPFCPEFHGAVQREAQADFSVAPPPPPQGNNAAERLMARLPEIRLLPVKQLVRALEWEDAANSFFESCRAVLGERLASGESIPGVKLVEGRSNRQWVSEDEVLAKFGGALGEKLYEKKLLTPAKLEKIVGKKAGVDDITFKPEGRKTVALDKDPRPVAKSAAQDDFAALPAPVSDGAETHADMVEHGQDALLDELVGPSAPSKARNPIWP